MHILVVELTTPLPGYTYHFLGVFSPLKLTYPNGMLVVLRLPPSSIKINSTNYAKKALKKAGDEPETEMETNWNSKWERGAVEPSKSSQLLNNGT